MAKVEGVTPTKLSEVEDAMGSSVVSGTVDPSGQLLLTTRNGAVITAGSVSTSGGGTDSGSVDESVTLTFVSPVKVWNCVHNLNHKFVDVTCYMSDGSEVVGDVAYIDSNTCTISWYYATAGNANIQR